LLERRIHAAAVINDNAYRDWHVLDARLRDLLLDAVFEQFEIVPIEASYIAVQWISYLNRDRNQCRFRERSGSPIRGRWRLWRRRRLLLS
jgi:hypothetical protein